MDLNTLDNHHPGTLEVLQELNLSNNPLAGYAPEFEEEDEENENQVVYESKVDTSQNTQNAEDMFMLQKTEDSEGNSAPSASDELSVENSTGSDSQSIQYDQKPILSLEPQQASVPSVPSVASSIPSANGNFVVYDDENNVFDVKTHTEQIDDVQSYELAPVDDRQVISIPDNMEIQKTAEELNDSKFHVFQLQDVIENVHRTENFREQMIGSLKLNMASQQRIKDVIKRLGIRLSAVKERHMVVFGMINGVSDRNRGRKSMNLPMFSNGYFCQSDTGWRVPPGVSDNDLEKQKICEPFESVNQDPPRKWSPEEDRALKKGVIEAASRPVLRTVRQSMKKAQKESMDSKLKKLNTDLHKLSKQSERDLIGGRHQEYDWEVTSITHLKSLRTPDECRLRWSNAAHLDIKRSHWSSDEKKNLRKWVKKFGETGCWRKISEKMVSRTAIQCCVQWTKMQQDEEKGRPWTKEEDRILLKAVEESQLHEDGHLGVSWNTVAAQINGRTPQQCTHRWKKSVDPKIKRGGWDIREDVKLLRAVQEMGEEWARIRDSKVLEDADGSFRTDMQMRDRYHNALSHGHIRGPWTQEEDKLLEEGHKIYGNQWTMVALHVQTRNDGQCLKRWHLREDHIARKKPIPYIKSTKACKVEKIRTLKKAIALEAHEKACHKQVARDPNLVILNRDIYHKDPATLVEQNKNAMFNMYPDLYGREKNPLPALLAPENTDNSCTALVPKKLDDKGYQPDTFKRFQDVISRMRNKGKAAENGLFFKHIIGNLKFKNWKGQHFGKLLRTADKCKDPKVWIPPSAVPMKLTEMLFDSVERKKIETRAQFLSNRPSVERRRRNQLKAILKMTLSASVALRTAAPEVTMMEGDPETLEAELNSAMQSGGNEHAEPRMASEQPDPTYENYSNFSGNLPIPMNHYTPLACLPGPSSRPDFEAEPLSNETLRVGGRYVLLDERDQERTAVELDQMFDAVMVDAP